MNVFINDKSDYNEYQRQDNILCSTLWLDLVILYLFTFDFAKITLMSKLRYWVGHK